VAADESLEPDNAKEKLGCWYRFKRLNGWTVSKERRVI